MSKPSTSHENPAELDTGTEPHLRCSSVAKTEKGRWERLWPVIACGAGLFSDGYLNNVSCFLHHPITPEAEGLRRLLIHDFGALDHRACKHDAQTYLSRRICWLYSSGKCGVDYVCWDGARDAGFWVYV